GTSSFGKRHSKSHTLCRRCGHRAFHRQHKSHREPTTKNPPEEGGKKAKKKKNNGTGKKQEPKQRPKKIKKGLPGRH
ncbi:hypothetical protein M408DRAFT_61984, partial [Serendipita vermifera MAFF 305830]